MNKELEQRYYEELASTDLVDIAPQSYFSASSQKPGLGPSNLIDGSPDTFWQTDGALPHILRVKFSKRVELCQISFFLAHPLDESFTPEEIVLYVGTGEHDLHGLAQFTFVEPFGWKSFDLEGFECFMIELRILSNHQSGKDTHIRGIKLFVKRRDRRSEQDMIALR